MNSIGDTTATIVLWVFVGIPCILGFLALIGAGLESLSDKYDKDKT